MICQESEKSLDSAASSKLLLPPLLNRSISSWGVGVSRVAPEVILAWLVSRMQEEMSKTLISHPAKGQLGRGSHQTGLCWPVPHGSANVAGASFSTEKDAGVFLPAAAGGVGC